MSPPSPPSSCSCSSSNPIWLHSYVKLRFFKRIRQFVRSQASLQRYDVTAVPSDPFDKSGSNNGEGGEEASLWELCRKEIAATEIAKLAKDRDVKVRKLIVDLGVLPVLVSMVVSEMVEWRRVVVHALIELAHGSFTIKTLMVEARILSKLPNNVNDMDKSSSHEFVKLILLLSSPAITQFTKSSTAKLIPFLISILEHPGSNAETKDYCLATLCNMSKLLDNSGPLISKGVVNILLKLSLQEELSEKALATFGNLVVTLIGKKAMENNPNVPQNLIEVLKWEEKPKCQELSAYILMILAHQSSTQIERMSESGTVPVLLKVALLGSPLAQKRALKLLQWFKDERQVKIGPHSGPQTGRFAIGSPVNHREAQEGKKIIKSLVKQSLNKNLEMTTMRACTVESGKLKSLVISRSSMSLPY